MDFLLEKKENPNILLEDFVALLNNARVHAFIPEHVSFIERNVMVLERIRKYGRKYGRKFGRARRK